MKKFAFTMLELVFVIVVAGILAAVFIPKMDRNNIEEAALQVTRHIRYTQHLAMSDDVYNQGQANWYKAMWKISFRSNNCYIVTSNVDLNNNADRTESAIDPLNGKYLYSNSSCTASSSDNEDMLLEDRFGIDSIAMSGGCGPIGTQGYIAFDNLGRPHNNLGSATGLMTRTCTLTLSSGTKTATIVIEPETGYTHFPTYNF